MSIFRNLLYSQEKKTRSGFTFTIQPDSSNQYVLKFSNSSFINPIFVDWGDGNLEEVNNVINITHTYNDNNMYDITIISDTKKMPYVVFKDDLQIFKVKTPFLECYSGLKINTDFNNCFARCKNLSSVPYDLLYNNPKITKFQGGLQVTAIEAIPDGLFDKTTIIDQFYFCFYNCKGLKYVPKNLFDNSTNILSVMSLFQDCSSINTEVPELWLKFPNATHTSCYRGCTNALNYANIPADWK